MSELKLRPPGFLWPLRDGFTAGLKARRFEGAFVSRPLRTALTCVAPAALGLWNDPTVLMCVHRVQASPPTLSIRISIWALFSVVWACFLIA